MNLRLVYLALSSCIMLWRMRLSVSCWRSFCSCPSMVAFWSSITPLRRLFSSSLSWIVRVASSSARCQQTYIVAMKASSH